MKLDQYIDVFNGAPMRLEAFAESATQLAGQDAARLREAAIKYVEARVEFLNQLDNVGVVRG
jgi:hypothetical protein